MVTTVRGTSQDAVIQLPGEDNAGGFTAVDVGNPLTGIIQMTSVTMYAGSWNPVNLSDDTIGLGIYIYQGGTVLAAADSSGTRVSLGSTNTPGSVNFSQFNFPYVNPTASQAQWQQANINITQSYTRNMGGDNAYAVLPADSTMFAYTYSINNSLNAADVESASELTSPTLTVDTGADYQLYPVSVESVSDLSPSPVIGQNYSFTAVNTESLTEVAGEERFKVISTVANPSVFGTGTGDGFGSGLAVYGDYIIAGAFFEDDATYTSSGAAYVIHKITGNVLYTKTDPNNYSTSLDDKFGYSVAIGANYFAVSAFEEDGVSGDWEGCVYVYDMATGTLQNTYTPPGGDPISDQYGKKILISGDKMYVSAIQAELGIYDSSGAVYEYDLASGTPTAVTRTYVNPNVDDLASNDLFGCDMDISGDYLLVGAYGESKNTYDYSGAAYLIQASTGTVLQTFQNPNPFGTEDGDYFGWRVAVNDTYSAIGTPQEDYSGGTGSGKTYIFKNSDGSLFKTLNNPNPVGTETTDLFGSRLRFLNFKDSYLIVSATMEDEGSYTDVGRVYVYDENFNLVHTILNPNSYGTPQLDYFGKEMAYAGGNHLILSSSDADASGANSGAVYTYDIIGNPTLVETAPDHILLADDVETTSEVSAPVLTEQTTVDHVLLADDVQSLSELTTPAANQLVAILADDVETTSEVTAATVGQAQVLLADDVETTSELTTPNTTETNQLLSVSVEALSENSTPSIGQVHNVAHTPSQSLSEVSSPDLDEDNTLDATDVQSSSTLTLPVVGQTHAVLADDVETTSEVSGPNLAETNTLTSVSVEAAAEVSSPVIAQAQVVLADDVEATSEVTTNAITQVHAVLADDVESLSETSLANLTESNSLTATSVETTSEVTTNIVGQVHNILADDVQGLSEVSVPDVDEANTFDATDVESSSTLTLPVIAQAQAILADDVETTSEVTTATVGQVHTVLADDVESLSEVTANTVGQLHNILADDTEATTATSTNTLTQLHSLLATSVETTSELTGPVLSEASSSLLADDVETTSEVSVPVFAAVSILLADDVETTSEVSVPDVDEANTLDATDVQSSSTLSLPLLAQSQAALAEDVEAASEVSVASLVQEHSLLAISTETTSEVSQPAIIQVHAVAANDSEAASEVDSPVMGVVVHLFANSTETTSELTVPQAAQSQGLLANDVETTSEVSSPNIDEDNTLDASDVQSSSTLTLPAITQLQAVTADDVETTSEVSVPTATANAAHVSLTAVSVEATAEVSSPTINQVQNMTVVSVASFGEAANTALAQLHVVGGTDVETTSELSFGGVASYGYQIDGKDSLVLAPASGVILYYRGSGYHSVA